MDLALLQGLKKLGSGRVAMLAPEAKPRRRSLHPLEIYLDRLQEIRASRRGTPELSYRVALENFLNAVGKELDPAVQATAGNKVVSWVLAVHIRLWS